MKSPFPAGYIPKYFSRTEFQLATPPCELEDMDELFLRKLDKLREYCGFPLSVNCFYRSVEWDKAHGRDGHSFHCKGRAADIRCLDSTKRFKILQYATMCGLNGIGVYKRFIHVDDRPSGVCWYGE